MKAVALIFGVLLLLGGGAVAGAQFVSMDLSFLDSIAGAKEFLASQTALYAGGGVAGLGLILFIVGLLPGGKKEKPARAAPQRAAAPAPKAAAQPKPQVQPKAAPQPAPAKAAAKPAAKPAAATKPVASGSPPSGGARQAAPASTDAPTWMQDPRLTNRKRVSDLVAINDALKAYHAKHGKYPKADKFGGFLDRGKAWIPGLSPEFIPDLPRDPAQSDDRNGPQYLYASDGTGYKLVAKGVSLVGGTNVEVLGVRFDPGRQNTAESAAFGFWTQAYEQLGA